MTIILLLKSKCQKVIQLLSTRKIKYYCKRVLSNEMNEFLNWP